MTPCSLSVPWPVGETQMNVGRPVANSTGQDNNALKPTRSAFLPLSGPRGLVQCSTLHRVGHRLRGFWSSDPTGLVEVTTQTQHLRRSGGTPINLGPWPDSRRSEKLGQHLHRVRVVPLPIWRGRLLWAQPTVLVCGSSHQGLSMPVSLASGSAVARSHGEQERTVPQTTGCRTIG